MKINNYNTSTQENAIEITCSYDQDLSRYWFEEFLREGLSDELNSVELINSSYRNDNKYFLHDSKASYEIEIERDYIDDLFYMGIIEKDDNIKDEDLIGTKINIDSYNMVRLLKAGYDFVEKYLYENTIRDYSQGEYATIYTVKPLENSQKNYLEKLFFDCPFYCVIKVDDEEINIHEEVNDLYWYSKKEVIDILSNNYDLSDYALEFIENNLPDYPRDYL